HPEDEATPAAAAPTTGVGLPRRVRQASLSPQLRAGPIGRPLDDDVPPVEALHAVRSALLRDDGPGPEAPGEDAAPGEDPPSEASPSHPA
ncbi:MAG TPA: hypothetical protein VGR21_13630, partial [Cryptosporangiaceae bacterium]|nr:hypothetical protein [Cryptosporangiaceae bacterium]